MVKKKLPYCETRCHKQRFIYFQIKLGVRFKVQHTLFVRREFGNPGNEAGNPVNQVGAKLPHKVVTGPKIFSLSCQLFEAGSPLGNKWSACGQSLTANSTETNSCFNSQYMQVT